MNSTDIETAVKKGFGGVSYWISQCRVGCGFGEDGERTVDLWGISVKRPYHRLSVEIKVSRSDFTRDMRQPLKQRRARLMANQFFFAAPVGILTAHDMPTWAGLIEVSDRGEANVSVPAPWFDSAPPTWSFVASLVRRFEKALYEPSVNVLDACSAALDAMQRGMDGRTSQTVHRARMAVYQARKDAGEI